MSRRISMVDAKRKYQKEQRIRRLQKEGKPIPHSWRGKKAKYQTDKQGGIIERMKDRIKGNRGTMPEHLMDEENEEVL